MKYAILGSACYLPGNNNSVIDFKNFLINQGDGIKKSNRWDTKYWKQRKDLVIEQGGFVDEFFHFDPSAFNMSTQEANQVDLQQKLLLKTTCRLLFKIRV